MDDTAVISYIDKSKYYKKSYKLPDILVDY